MTRWPRDWELHDLAADGRLLVELTAPGRDMWRLTPAGSEDLGWLTWTVPADLSADGRTVLFNDWPAVYVRRDGGPVRLEGTSGSGSGRLRSPAERQCR